MECDQTTGRGLLVQHLGPAIVGEHSLGKVLSQRHVVEPAFLLQRQQGEAVHDFTREHAGAVALSYAVLVIDLDQEETGRGRVLLIRRDADDKDHSS